ncbi:hypothetical protein FACS1894103_3180 [Campylobacterota bacterium]|nr:hypothetical protein FACS1894103_3180 [Campylobacterota bacterium]
MTEHDEQLFAAYIGNADKLGYYSRQLLRFTANGALQYRSSWSWWAFAAMPFFLLYRKLYVEAAVGTVLTLLFLYLGDGWLSVNYGEALLGADIRTVDPQVMLNAMLFALGIMLLPPIVFGAVSPYLVIRRFFKLQAAVANLSPDEQLAMITQKGGVHKWAIVLFAVVELAFFAHAMVQAIGQLEQITP